MRPNKNIAATTEAKGGLAERAIGQKEQRENGQQFRGYPHLYHHSYHFYNSPYHYPFMQPPHLYPYLMPPYPQAYPIHQIPKCISSPETLKIMGGLAKNIKNQEKAEIFKFQPSQDEPRKKASQMKQKRIRKKRTLKMQMEQVVAPKRKNEKRQQRSIQKCQAHQRYSLPKSAQEQQELLFLFKKIINVFINEQYSTVTKQQWIIEFTSAFQKIEIKHLLNLLVVLQNRFDSLKKTKEEFIKYIIRKIYHLLTVDPDYKGKPQLVRLQQFHMKNLLSHGTMNYNFLQKQFSNPLFVKLYREFMSNMEAIMEEDNKKRLERYSLIVLNCWKQENIGKIYQQKKMPWVKSFKLQIAFICQLLLRQHADPSEENVDFKKKQENQ